MKPFAWPTRLKYGMLAALAGWLAAEVVTFPFELGVAWRYVDGRLSELPLSLAEGLVVWAVFSFSMAMVGFLPLALPLIVFIPPGWVVRWRYILIPAAGLAAMAAMYKRMGLLNIDHFHHYWELEAFFLTAPNFFVITFALVTAWVYAVLAKRRLEQFRN
jgi:hypothetical protein